RGPARRIPFWGPDRRTISALNATNPSICHHRFDTGVAPGASCFLAGDPKPRSSFGPVRAAVIDQGFTLKNIINGGPNPAAAQPAGKGHAFAALGISAELVRAVEQEGYVEPTPVQRDAVPAVLAGRDLLACAQTGTGKTAAFLLPILHHLRKRGRTGAIRALVLAPTRELAGQIAERAEAYGRHGDLRCALLYGGVAQRRQERDLERKPDLLVATPGRLLDLLQQRLLSLSAVEVFVLDEADRMLDMGFIHDVRRVIAALPAQRQTLPCAATAPAPL